MTSGVLKGKQAMAIGLKYINLANCDLKYSVTQILSFWNTKNNFYTLPKFDFCDMLFSFPHIQLTWPEKFHRDTTFFFNFSVYRIYT
jgi:hypothetical protein